MEVESKIVENKDTDEQEMLRSFCENGFDGDDEKTGLVLGRPASEIRDMIDGGVDIDHDLAMKVRGIAEERGIDLR